MYIYITNFPFFTGLESEDDNEGNAPVYKVISIKIKIESFECLKKEKVRRKNV